MSTGGDWRYAGVACPHCGLPLDHRQVVSGAQTCPACGRGFEAVRFDPPAPDVSVPRVSEAGPEAKGACPQHPGNVALGPCSRCGVFLCALCRIDTDSRVLCPPCFERLADEGGLPSLVASYRDFGRVQSSLLALGLLLAILAPIAGPGSLYYGARARRQAEARGEPRGWLHVWGLYALGVLEALGGVALIVLMVRA